MNLPLMVILTICIYILFIICIIFILNFNKNKLLNNLKRNKNKNNKILPKPIIKAESHIIKTINCDEIKNDIPIKQFNNAEIIKPVIAERIF